MLGRGMHVGGVLMTRLAGGASYTPPAPHSGTYAGDKHRPCDRNTSGNGKGRERARRVTRRREKEPPVGKAKTGRGVGN